MSFGNVFSQIIVTNVVVHLRLKKEDMISVETLCTKQFAIIVVMIIFHKKYLRAERLAVEKPLQLHVG